MSKKLIYLVSFVLVLRVAGNASADLVAHWNLEEGSGATTTAAIGSPDADGTLVGATWVAADVAPISGSTAAVFFESASGDRIETNYVCILGQAERTVAAWIKAEPTQNNNAVFVGWGPNNPTERYSFRLNASAGNGSLWALRLSISGSYAIAQTSLNDGQWHHVAVTHAEGSSIEQVSFYVDGQLEEGLSGTSGGGVINTASSSVVLGTSGHTVKAYRFPGDIDVSGFDGAIDDVRIYDHMLSAAEIKALSARSKTYNPTPADGTLLESTWVSLSWKPGTFAVSYDVYFGENFDEVSAGAESTFQGNQASTSFPVGSARSPYLVPGTTYYWRIDEIEAGNTYKGDVWSFTVPPRKAYEPDPADGVFHEDTWINLSWSGKETVVSHDIYFGDNFDDVDAGTGDTFRGNQAETFYPVGLPGFPYPDGLVPGTTYYWRIDEVEAGNTYKGDVWSFWIAPNTAYNPYPPNGAVFADPDVELGWMAGFGATLHNVYFGNNFEDVDNATEGTLQKASTYTPGILANDTVYYWRVDELTTGRDSETHKGDVWSFRTRPITDPSLVGWWKFDEDSGTTAIDSSGNGFNIRLPDTTWEDGVFGGAVHFHGVGYGGVGNFRYSDNAITVCAWVWHDAFRIGKIEQYVTVVPSVAVIRKEGDGRLHFYIKTDGNLRHLRVNYVRTEGQWHHVAGTWDGLTQRLYFDGVEIASQEPGGVLGNTSYVEMSSGPSPFNGMLDEVRIYNRALTQNEIQVVIQGKEFPFAFSPTPADGATLVDTPVILSWTPGFGAQLHRVYFGDNFDDVNNAAGGIPQSAASFTPGPLEQGKTYYWRVDEFDVVARHKGDVWSFTTARASGEWTYDGGILVGAYYYAWYRPTRNTVSWSLRGHLVPEQTPELGEYDSSSEEVIAKHIDYSHRANIHFWAIGGQGRRGQGRPGRHIFKHNILPHRYAGELRYAILYECGALGSFSNPDYSNLLPDFQYLADNYFDHPYYLKIDGRPVVFIFITDKFFRKTPGYTALAALRSAFPNLYIVADDIAGPNYSSSYASKWDAVTSYDSVFGWALWPYGSTRAALDQLEIILSNAKTAANSVGVGLIPFAMPGWNSRVVRYGNSDGAPRYFEDDPSSSEGDLFRAMLRDVVVPKVDPLAENMLMVTSFNEWGEDTQIEPTMGTGSTTNIDDSASGSDYTQGDYYTDYGYLYLDILREETSFLEGDSLSEALDTALSFTTGGSADWFSQTTTTRYDGDAAQSGDISHSQDSWMQTTVSGTGTVKFYWKVSSEEDFDFLEFYIDDSLQEEISGSLNWQQKWYTISTSGSHTLEWRYMKDGSGNVGSDCGWVDKVEFVTN